MIEHRVLFTQDEYVLSCDEYMRIFKLLDEARDTIQSLTVAQLKLNNLKADFADRLDEELKYMSERA